MTQKVRIGNRRAGFTLIETMIVVSIISIVASFALPSLSQARRQANETSAIAMCRGLFSAQQAFRANGKVSSVPGVEFANTLRELESAGLLPPELAQDSTQSASPTVREYRGYSFFIGGNPSNENPLFRRMVVLAFPRVAGVTGDRSFLLIEEGPIYQRQGPAFINPDVGNPL